MLGWLRNRFGRNQLGLRAIARQRTKRLKRYETQDGQFDHQVVTWLEGDHFDLFEELKDAQRTPLSAILRVLNTFTLTEQEMDAVKNAIVHRIVTVHHKDDAAYEQAINRLRSLLVRIDGDMETWFRNSPSMIRQLLAMEGLSEVELNSIKQVIVRRMPEAKRNEQGQVQPDIDVWKHLLMEVEDRIREAAINSSG